MTAARTDRDGSRAGDRGAEPSPLPRRFGRPPLLRDPMASRVQGDWTADPVLDRALGHTAVRGAAEALFGRRRATRSVVRALARALLGGDQASVSEVRSVTWRATTVALAFDGAAGSELTRDDLVAILTTPLPTGSPPHAVGPNARSVIAATTAGWPRHARRDTAVALLTHHAGQRVFTDLGRLRIDPAVVAPWPGSSLTDLLEALHHLTHDRAGGLAASRRHRPTPYRRPQEDGWEVRVLSRSAQFAAEARWFANCLEGWFELVVESGYRVATVHHQGRPVAAVATDPADEVIEVLGPANRGVHAADLAAILPRIGRDGGSARIARAVTDGRHHWQLAAIVDRAVPLLLREPCHLAPWRRPGEEAVATLLRLLDGREAALARAGRTVSEQLDTSVTLRSSAQAERDEDPDWVALGVALVACHVDDDVLITLRDGPAFRHRAASVVLGLLAGTRSLPDRPLHPGLVWLLDDPRLAPAVHEGIRLVLEA